MPSKVIAPPVEDTPAAANAEQDMRPLWEIVVELGESIPREEWDNVPHDGSKNYKHYLYGARKIE